MCGIFGFVSPSGHLNAEDAKFMCEQLRHRGPDTQDFAESKVFMGHTRLSIIDLSAQANQPMSSQNGRYQIVFNGEIYNYQEIAKELLESGHGPFRTHSDTEVILEAFFAWGPDFVQKLNGMFAIAITELETGKLFLFRDRIGIKPLYYYEHLGDFIFASELKAISGLKKIKPRLSLSERAIELFLHLGYIPAPLSIYNEVKKFPQGHWGLYENGKLKIHPYWQAIQKLGAQPVTNKEEALQQLGSLVESSVRYRLISDVPFGTFLSGGIDSSLVTAMASRIVGSSLKTFSIAFDDAKYNEAPFAAQVAQYLGTNHHELTVTEADAEEIIPMLPGFFDEPFADSSAIPTFLLSKLTRNHVTMALSGDGGDELFHGYGAYQWANRLSNTLFRLPAPIIASMLSFGDSRQRRVGRLLQIPAKDALAAHVFSQEQYFFSRNEVGKILKNIRDFSVPSFPEKLPGWMDAASRQAFFDLSFYLPDDLLVKVDRASMAVALEARVPLLDYRIVEFALNLHPSLKIHNNTQKYLLKELLYTLVPRGLFDRPKWGFSIPLPRWMKSNLKPLVNDYLSQPMVQKWGILHPDRVQNILKAFGKPENEFLYNRIWLMLVLQQWLDENA